MARSTDRPAAVAGRVGGKLTAEDRRIWQAAMRDVHTIERRPAPPTPAAKTGAEPAPAPVPIPPAPPAGVAHYHRHPHPPNPGIDRATLSRLKRGAIPIERTLDLHGMTEAAAHAAVTRFVKTAWSEGVRLVLIITGKGGIGGEGGVLRKGLPRWLASGSAAAHVLRLETAQSRHGGDGAFYLLLRRRRSETHPEARR